MSHENLPKTRAEAKRLGITKYNTSKPCKYGHLSDRSTINGECVECRRKRGKDFRKNDPDRARAKDRLHYQNNKESYALRHSKWCSLNREYIREYARLYYYENHEYFLALQKRYRDSENGKASIKAAYSRIRAKRASAPGTHTMLDIDKIIARGMRCFVCGRKFTKSNPPTLEHVIALSHELGTDDASNLAPSHLSCNQSKSASRFNPITGQGILI